MAKNRKDSGGIMNNEDFVTFLVDETLSLHEKHQQELSTLELKLKDYGLEYMRGDFIPQLQVLRFRGPLGPLDIPINWSTFAVTQNVILDEKNDTDCFFAVIKHAWKFPIHKLLITHADGFCYLVGLKVGEEAHLHDLLSAPVWPKSA